MFDPKTIDSKYLDQVPRDVRDYPLIWLWHRNTGSYGDYVYGVIERARRDGAPKNAIYYSQTDECWATSDTIRNEDAHRALGLGDIPPARKAGYLRESVKKMRAEADELAARADALDPRPTIADSANRLHDAAVAALAALHGSGCDVRTIENNLDQRHLPTMEAVAELKRLISQLGD